MPLNTRIARWLFAGWHLNRMPPPTTAQMRLLRRRWCRDHCGDFAARWFGLGAGLWTFFLFPFRPMLPGEAAFAWPGIAALAAFVMGIWYILRQIYAQSKVGPPPVEPPVELRRDDQGDDR